MFGQNDSLITYLFSQDLGSNFTYFISNESELFVEKWVISQLNLHFGLKNRK